jgi:hypothetical protein
VEKKKNMRSAKGKIRFSLFTTTKITFHSKKNVFWLEKRSKLTARVHTSVMRAANSSLGLGEKRTVRLDLFLSGIRVRIIIAISSHSGCCCIRLPELEKAFSSVSTKGEEKTY